MEIGLAVGGAFLSSALNVLFDRLSPQGELLKMFQRDNRDVRLLKKLRLTLLGLQAVLSDAENKQASNPYVRQWLSELQDAVDGAENLMEEVNYEVLRLNVEGQHQNLAETSNQQTKNEKGIRNTGKFGLSRAWIISRNTNGWLGYHAWYGNTNGWLGYHTWYGNTNGWLEYHAWKSSSG